MLSSTKNSCPGCAFPIVNELRLFRLGIAPGRHGNFSRAVKALDLTQPTLSRGIAELERALELPLFDRTRKGLVPTAFARLMARGSGALVTDTASMLAGALLRGTSCPWTSMPRCCGRRMA
jgi:DNA-binding transcriptional LysR family regulator